MVSWYTPTPTPTPVTRTPTNPYGINYTPIPEGELYTPVPQEAEPTPSSLLSSATVGGWLPSNLTDMPVLTQGTVTFSLPSTDDLYSQFTNMSTYDPYSLSDSVLSSTTIDATTKYLADLQSLYQMSSLGEAAELRKSDFVLKNKQLDIYEELGLGQLALEGKKASYAYQLGLGQIGLGYAQLDVQKLLGLGTLAVQRESISAQERMNNAAIAANREASSAAQAAADQGLQDQLALEREKLSETKREFDLQHALETMSTQGQLALGATELLQNLTMGPQNWERYWYLSRGEGAPTAESQPAYDAVYNLVRQMSQWSFSEGGTAPAWTGAGAAAATTTTTPAATTPVATTPTVASEMTPAWTQAYKQFRQPQYQWAGNQ